MIAPTGRLTTAEYVEIIKKWNNAEPYVELIIKLAEGIRVELLHGVPGIEEREKINRLDTAIDALSAYVDKGLIHNVYGPLYEALSRAELELEHLEATANGLIQHQEERQLADMNREIVGLMRERKEVAHAIVELERELKSQRK